MKPRSAKTHKTRRRQLTAAQVLRRYKDDSLPAFEGISLTEVNQVGNFNERPLHVACSRGILEEVAALVKAGADVNAPGELGNTPLHEAIGQHHIKVIQFLLDHGASKEKKNEFGQVPLDVAKLGTGNDVIDILKR